MKRRPALFALLSAAAAGRARSAEGLLHPGDDPAASPIWQKVRASLFGSRPIEAAPAGLLSLDAPVRAFDAAVVPVSIRTGAPAAGRRIAALYLVIDANPSPISGIFRFAPDSTRADIETRVRVDAYSHVRAVAETEDGRLLMTTRFVKASGGCSAPAGGDAAAALASLGQTRLRIEGEVKPGEPVLAQVIISHPNHSGLAMDQLSRQFTPAHYVRRIDISYGGRPVMSADVDFSISENPNLRFYFVPRGPGELRAEVVDSLDRHFAGALAVRSTDP